MRSVAEHLRSCFPMGKRSVGIQVLVERESVMENTYDPSSEGRSVACPHCGAYRGRPCTTTKGRPLKTIHKMRKDLEGTNR